MAGTGVRVDEAPWILEVNHRFAAAGTCTPGREAALAVGRMLADGFVMEPADVRTLDVAFLSPGVTIVRATVPTERSCAVEEERRHRAERGCGLLHFVHCDAAGLRRTREAAVPPVEDFPPLLRSLFRMTAERHPEGGMHAAALTDGEALIEPVEDVGRHNAVNTALGAAFLAGLDLARYGLVVSARVSGEMAQAAARSGIAWLASRSLATSLALDIAAAAALPIVERAAGREAHRHGDASERPA